MDSQDAGSAAPEPAPDPWAATGSAGLGPGPLDLGADADPALTPYHQNPDDTGVLAAVPDVAPAVVAVVITHDPGPWFGETLRALGAQTYPNLSVLVVDAASTVDPTPRVAEVLPTAYVKRLDHNPGFGGSVNEVLELVEGAAFYCVCHDDVAPDPDAIRLLVEEAFRSNAGVIGPKLVDWDDPRVLQQVGVAADKTGVLAPYAEAGELDQEQHDAVRDVFAVPSGCTLVRADLFAAVGGFDSVITRHGEDLDLSWRAHVAGARVMVAPAARARHREADAERGTDADRARLTARHRIRTMLSCYSRLSLIRVVPQALLVSFLEAVYGLFVGRSDHSRAEASAWWWNLQHQGEIRARRKALRRIRRVPDSEIRNLQTRGSARLSAFVRGQIGAGDDRLQVMARPRAIAGSLRAGPRRSAILVVAAVVVTLLVGTRGLLAGDLPAVGELARFSQGPTAMLKSWFSGWRDSGLGASTGAPAGLGVFGVLGFVFFGAMGVLRKVLVLGMLPLGAWGAWRLARPIGSTRAAAAALVVYAAIPVPYNALAQGRWGALVVWAFAPWFFLGLGRASGVAPFGRRDLRAGEVSTQATRPTRPLGSQIVGLGVAVALASVVVPAAAGVVLVMAVGIVVGSLLTFRWHGSHRVLLGAVGGVVVAALLHLPWALGFVHHGRDWLAFAGGRAGEGGSLGFTRLLRFDSGPFGAAPLGWAFLVVAALPLLIGRGWRLEWAVRGWTVALCSWGLLWAGQAGWLHRALPPVEVLLAPAAIGLALAAALGVAAFEVDLPSYKFGWRQAASIVAGLAFLAGAIPVLGAAFQGRWKTPSTDFAEPLSFIGDHAASASFRVLWLGDPDTMPVGAWRLDDRISYGTSNHGLPRVEELWALPDPGASSQLGAAVRLALRGDTTRLGHLLAPMGVRYIVVPEQPAPSPSWARHQPPPAALPAALDEQLDLAPQTALNPAVTVWTNRAWQPLPALLGAGQTSASDASLADAAGLDLPVANAPALRMSSGGRGASGRLAGAGQLVVDQADDGGWKLTVDGDQAPRSKAYGGVQRYDAASGGAAKLRFHTPLRAVGLAVLQLALWLGALEMWRRLNGADRRRVAREVKVS